MTSESLPRLFARITLFIHTRAHEFSRTICPAAPRLRRVRNLRRRDRFRPVRPVVDKRKRIHEIPRVREPQGPAFISGVSRLLVCSRGDGTCRSFDAATYEEGPWIDLGRNADNARFDAGNNVVLIGSGGEPGGGLLSEIHPASLIPVNHGGTAAPPVSPADFLLDRPRQAQAKSAVELPSHPESFQVDPRSRRVFVNVPDAHEIAVFDLTTNGFRGWVSGS